MASGNENDFNSLQFEKKLTGLKDSQESINKCCHWCLENRQHHKKIVSSWLSVLKRVKIDHRLTLFYLANDVIQYSKRRNYDFVESWGTTLQKATTMVRDEKIKHKILRIFKIWEQRGVYSEEFIADLCGLISVSPAARKNDEPHEFQSSYLITKIRNCAKLENDTDNKLRKLIDSDPKKIDGESLIASLKHRAHVDDVEKEVEDYVKCIELYLSALKLEIKARSHLITLLNQAETQLSNDKKDVKLVANAYKTFSSRVKHLKKKLEEMKPALTSPIPSPDINAPSPSPDSDIELPVTEPSVSNANYAHFQNPGFYTPVTAVTTTTESGSFTNNGFSSFLGSNMPFDLDSINSSIFGSNPPLPGKPATTHTTYSYDVNNSNSALFSNSQNHPPTTPTPAPQSTDYQYNSQVPLLPPPLPPFTKSGSFEGGYNDSYNCNSDSSFGNSSYDPAYEPTNSYRPNDSLSISVPAYQPDGGSYGATYTPTKDYRNAPFPSSDEYNPEEEIETWEPEPAWDQPPTDLETPESPPIYEKKSYNNAPIEYHDNQMNQTHGTGVDVDHRILPILPPQKIPELDHGHRKKDVDHRNLISLTESPKDSSPKSWSGNKSDQDYRVPTPKPNCIEDKDYRLGFSLDNLSLPPPPPPPAQTLTKKKSRNHSPKKLQDNVESIDMELSDDEHEESANKDKFANNLEPPPPFPDMLDEMDTPPGYGEDPKEWPPPPPPPMHHDDMEQMCDEGDFCNNLPPPRMPHNEHMWPPPECPTWMEPGFVKEKKPPPGRGHRGHGFREFRGRGQRGGHQRGFRGGPYHRGMPRGPPRSFARGMRGNRSFNRGNFRGGY